MFKEKNHVRNTVNSNIDTKELPFVKLKDLDGQSIQLWGFFFTNGDYGKQLVTVAEDKLINMPNRYVSEFEAWTDEEVKAITEGKLILANIRPYTAKSGKVTYTFDYEDSEVVEIPFS